MYLFMIGGKLHKGPVVQNNGYSYPLDKYDLSWTTSVHWINVVVQKLSTGQSSKHILASMIYFDSDMSKSTNMVVYFDWKTVIYIYACGKCRTQFMLPMEKSVT
jgi:hypothetical protein